MKAHKPENTAPPKGRFPCLHRDGTVSYWSYFEQRWIERSFYVPAEELEKMNEHDRARVMRSGPSAVVC